MITYYRDLQAYGDGRHLYVSRTGITNSWWGVGPSTLRSILRRRRPDLVIEHWGGACGGALELWRRDRVRKWLGGRAPTRSEVLW